MTLEECQKILDRAIKKKAELEGRLAMVDEQVKEIREKIKAEGFSKISELDAATAEIEASRQEIMPQIEAEIERIKDLL